MKNSVSLLEYLDSVFSEIVSTCFGEVHLEDWAIKRCKDSSFGHFQFNESMKLAKIVGENPLSIANKICDAAKNRVEFESVSVSNPGFVNIKLSKKFLREWLLKEKKFFLLEGKRFLVDFSSPNIAKQMHVGHLRSTIIGKCIVNVLKFLGADVYGVNHLGDWGTQFGMIIAIVDKKGLSLEDLESVNFLNLYQEAKRLFDSDEDFARKSKQMVVKLQSLDPYAKSIWEVVCNRSKNDYQKIYDILDVDFLYRGESFYNKFIPKMIRDLETMGFLSISDGAKCFFVPSHDIPLIIEKTEGGYTYATTDLAAIRYRAEMDNVDCILYVTDSGQADHFSMLFEAAKIASFIDKHECIHIGFGLVLGEDGKKFKTRSGFTEPLIDLLNVAVDMSKKILIEKGWDQNDEMFEKTASAIGISSIKFSDLCNGRMSDYKFSYERMLKFEGKTAPFIMYSYVRAVSILKNLEVMQDVNNFDFSHSSEENLILNILLFQDSLILFLKRFEPCVLTDYVYELCCSFNAFLRDCRVIGDKMEISRHFLVISFANVCKSACRLIGIDLVDRM